MKLRQRLTESRRPPARPAEEAVEDADGLPTRRQWFLGAAMGGTALVADAAFRPRTALAQSINFVDITSNQTISGIKTFTQPPVVPAGTFALPQVPGTAMVAANVTGPFAPSSPGATAAARFVGGTASGSPTSGTFAVGDFVIDQTGKVWICTVAGAPGTWAQQAGAGVDLTSNQTIGGVKTFTQPPVVPAGTFALPQVPGTAMVAANVTGPFAPSSPGASAATRYVGGTASGAPAAGTFEAGDFVIDQTGKVWICTAAGAPGTWVQQAGAGVDLTSNQTIGGVKTFTSPPVVPAGTFALPQVPGTAMVAANVTGPFAPSSAGASAATRYVGGTTSGAPETGTFEAGDFVIDQTGKVWICTAAGAPGTWVHQSATGVDLTSDQTVAGVKTFTSPPVLPVDAIPLEAVAGLAAALAEAAIPAGTYLGMEGPLTGPSPGTLVGSVRVADDASDRLHFRADGAIVGGGGTDPPRLEFKPNDNGAAWEINRGYLKIRADTDTAIAPEIHLHSINGTGNDHLAWGMGIDVANPDHPARDLAFFKGVGGRVADEFYGNHRGLLPSTWAFGQAPADDAYKLSVVAGGSADPPMGGLKIQIGGSTTGNAMTLKDGLQDRFWLDANFWVRGQGNVSGASLQVKADATSSRTIALALGDGSGAFGFEHNTSSYIRFRAITTATNIVQFGANGTTFLYGAVTMNAGGTVQGGNLTIQDNRHLVLGTTKGTKIGTASNQKLGFFNATPVAQPSDTPPPATNADSAIALVNDLRAKLLSLGLVA